MADVQLISDALFDLIAERALKSPRKRMTYNFHSTATENPHRFLNIRIGNTYIRPHRHLDPPKPETFSVLEGVADVIIFNDKGSISARHRLGRCVANSYLWGVDLAAGVWHTRVPVTDRVVCFEVKPGPWTAANDKEFADWAPPEGDASVENYYRTLSMI